MTTTFLDKNGVVVTAQQAQIRGRTFDLRAAVAVGVQTVPRRTGIALAAVAGVPLCLAPLLILVDRNAPDVSLLAAAACGLPALALAAYALALFTAKPTHQVVLTSPEGEEVMLTTAIHAMARDVAAAVEQAIASR